MILIFPPPYHLPEYCDSLKAIFVNVILRPWWSTVCDWYFALLLLQSGHFLANEQVACPSQQSVSSRGSQASDGVEMGAVSLLARGATDYLTLEVAILIDQAWRTWVDSSPTRQSCLQLALFLCPAFSCAYRLYANSDSFCAKRRQTLRFSKNDQWSDGKKEVECC